MLLRYFHRAAEPARFAVLRDVPLFSGLSTHELETLDGLLHQRAYVKDEVIFDQDEEGQAIYFVLSGKVCITRQDQSDAVAVIEPGQFFGERALLEHLPRIAKAQVEEDCILAVLFRDDFLGLLHSYPQIAEKISQHCSLRNTHRILQLVPNTPPRLLGELREIPGPLTWVGIIASTCLTLFMFKKILWLVVPFLFALILYYLLAPIAKRMVLAGLSSGMAAVTLSGGMLLVTMLIVFLFYPFAMANGEYWQEAILRYLNGATTMLDQLLQSIQVHFSFLSKTDLSQKMWVEVKDFTEHFSDRYLGDLLLSIAAWLPSLLLTPIITFFLLKDGAYLRKMLGSAVPNAFFEKTLHLMHAVDRTARMYFVGLMKMTVIDTVMTTLGLWFLGFDSPLLLGLMVAVLCWIPYLGPLLGLAIVLMVGATDFPANLPLVYGVLTLFAMMRALDDFVFMPWVVGRSLHLHPLLTVLMFLIGEAIAGVAGLMLVIPILGIIMVLGETVEIILTDTRLQARHRYARRLRWRAATRDLAGF
ncbi:MAG TPA: AI-2E family transporter [Methylophilaceae bacterium]|nr:AI-2E family transporter [Methylophilaceae bacterium]